MTSPFLVRAALPNDASQMAEVHVAGWRQAYRGLMPDEVLDDPGFVARREQFWTRTLNDTRADRESVAVAERAGTLVGIASAGTPLDEDASWQAQLYVLYVLASEYGSGAGSLLLEAVIPRETAAALWVAEPNPRAQAFYRKHGFVPDGVAKAGDGITELRLVRGSDDREGQPILRSWPER